MSSYKIILLAWINCLCCKVLPNTIFNEDEIINKDLYVQVTRRKIEELLEKNDKLKYSSYINNYYKTNLPPNDIYNRIDEAYSYLLSYSSKTQNDISSYYNCVRNESQLNTYTFIIIQFDLQFRETYYPNQITYGLCLVEDISLYNYNSSLFTEDIIIFVNLLNKEADFMFFNSTTQLNIINVNEYQETPSQWYEIFSLSMCITFSTLMLIFIFINKVPECLFKCCFKKQGLCNHDKNNIKEEVNKHTLHEFVSCFSLTENNEELLSRDYKTKIYNDTGLSYTKGIRSICLILLIFGLTYMRIFQSSTIIFEEEKYKSALKSFIIPMFTFGLRYCPRIIFSISGFTFIYKLLCFLDNESEKISEIKRNSNEENNNDGGDTTYQFDASQITRKDMITVTESSSYNKLKYSSIIVFLMTQLNKFISGILMVIIFKTISAIMKNLSIFSASLAILYKDILGRLLFSDIFGHFFLYKNFYVFDGHLSGEKNYECCMRFFWVFLNEIFFFVFTTPLIFIWYKFKLSLNKLLLAMISLFLIARYLIYYLVIHNTNIITINNQYQKATNTVYDYYVINSFTMNPLYNYPTFLLGVFFGLMNYVLQKGMNEDDSEDSMVSFFVNSVYYFKYQPRILLYFEIIIEILLIGLIIIIEPLYHLILGKDDLRGFYVSEVSNAFYLIDVEVVIILIHLLLFTFYAKGGNLLTQMLSQRTWIKFNKLYFSVIISANVYILLILHQSETRISLEIFSVFFYGIIILISVIFFAYINCVLSEFPLKKLIKLIINKFIRKKTKK